MHLKRVNIVCECISIKIIKQKIEQQQTGEHRIHPIKSQSKTLSYEPGLWERGSSTNLGMALGKSFALSAPQFPHLSNGIVVRIYP